MPAQVQKSSLFKKLGQRGAKAIKAHAHDPVKHGRIDLPPGIKNGIAKLTKLYFDAYKTGDNKGELYLRGEGVVVFPKEVLTENGAVGIEGQTTSVMFPCCETKNKDLDYNMNAMGNQLKLLGADPDELAAAGEEEGGVEALAKAIEEAQPYFRFTTSPKFDQNDKKTVTGVWENWGGIKGPGYDLTDYDPQTSDDVDDDTDAKADVEEGPSKNGKVAAKKAKEPEPVDEEPDLDALAEVADDDSADEQADAQKQLKDIAIKFGLSKKWVEDVAKNWTAVAERVKERQAEADGEEAAEDIKDTDDEPEESRNPEEGDVVKYKGAKDKKATEYEVTKVDPKKKTCDLKQIDDGKTKYLSVKFDAVEMVE